MSDAAAEIVFDPCPLPPEGEFLIIERGDRSWLVAVIVGQPYTVRNHCGHLPQRMDGGRLDGRCWRCPHHGIRYDLVTGEVVDNRGFDHIDDLEPVPCEVRGAALVLHPAI